MTDFSNKKVSQLREILVNSGKYTKEQAEEIKGKGALVTAVLDLEKDEDIDFSQLIQVEPETLVECSVAKSENLPRQPEYTSLEWHDYVMTHFSESELIDGKYPTVVGLRRVSQLLLGPIISSGPTSVVAPTAQDKPGRATCTFLVTFLWTLDGFHNNGIREFSACAGAYPGSVDDEFIIFPEAIAETRAEVRALRRALNLKIVGYDELTNKKGSDALKENSSSGEWKEDSPVNDTQINFIKKRCEQLGINVGKFLHSNGWNYEELEKVTKVVAADMIKRLNDYQNNNNVEIPEEIKA